MKKTILPVVLAAILAGGCTSEKDASQVLLFVSVSERSVNSGENIYFDIEARTLHETIEQIEINTFDSSNGFRELYTENPGTPTYKKQYTYLAPDITSDSLCVEIRIRATDNLGYEQESRKNITVWSHTALLEEISGITLYSPHSGKPDGFLLTTVQPLLCETSAPEEIDLYLYAASDESPETLPREWRTQNDLLFSKANSFDYASANRSGLKATYQNAVKYNYVKDLETDDLILVGREEVWGIIKIVGIFDEDGSVNDRYILNLKKL